ncbi:MAG: threonine ammonia-lyase [Gemmatimonadota bacterium]
MLTLQNIREARERIRGEVALTPCTRSFAFQEAIPAPTWLKFENLHRVGAFKERGALNRLLLLSSQERERGVVTASAGNHAQAVAFHARRLGIPATIVMPETTPLIKVSNTRSHGARVILHGSHFSLAIEESHRLAASEGLTMVHAYDDEGIVAGQGTVGLELLEQVPELTTVVVPIGGGGLIGGIAMAIKEQRPDVRILGVESEAAPSALRSLEAGKIVAMETADTIADGIAVKKVGEVTFPLIQKYVDEVALVSDEEVAQAILLLLERERTVVEGAGAAGLAALLAGRFTLSPDEVVVAILCGGNIDVNLLARIIERGLVGDGRIARLLVRVRDRPGSLARLTNLVAKAGGNVLEISHRRAFADISVGQVGIVIQMETRGRDHVEEIKTLLEGEGHRVEEVV